MFLFGQLKSRAGVAIPTTAFAKLRIGRNIVDEFSEGYLDGREIMGSHLTAEQARERSDALSPKEPN
jgi:hypothetical protein